MTFFDFVFQWLLRRSLDQASAARTCYERKPDRCLRNSWAGFPGYEFDQCVHRYCANQRECLLLPYEQFLALGFAQRNCREGLRDSGTCLCALGSKLYHRGIRQPTARSTLADANEKRDQGIVSDFAHVLIEQATTLCADEPFGAQLEQAAYLPAADLLRGSGGLAPFGNVISLTGPGHLRDVQSIEGSEGLPEPLKKMNERQSYEKAETMRWPAGSQSDHHHTDHGAEALPGVQDFTLHSTIPCGGEAPPETEVHAVETTS